MPPHSEIYRRYKKLQDDIDNTADGITPLICFSMKPSTFLGKPTFNLDSLVYTWGGFPK